MRWEGKTEREGRERESKRKNVAHTTDRSPPPPSHQTYRQIDRLLRSKELQSHWSSPTCSSQDQAGGSTLTSTVWSVKSHSSKEAGGKWEMEHEVASHPTSPNPTLTSSCLPQAPVTGFLWCSFLNAPRRQLTSGHKTKRLSVCSVLTDMRTINKHKQASRLQTRGGQAPLFM